MMKVRMDLIYGLRYILSSNLTPWVETYRGEGSDCHDIFAAEYGKCGIRREAAPGVKYLEDSTKQSQ
jgi:hypothetical protein